MRQAIFAGIAALLFSAGLPLFLFSDIEQQPVEEILLVIEIIIEARLKLETIHLLNMLMALMLIQCYQLKIIKEPFYYILL